MISNAFQLVAVLIIAACFYLLAVSLKDARLKMEHPVLNSRVIKLALVGIFTSQLWYLLFPNNHDAYWILFDSSVMLALVKMAASYRKKYVRIGIDFVDHRAYLDIPNDRYVEYGKGVYLRVYKEGQDPIVPNENELIEIVNNFDHSRFLPIFFRADKGAYFPPHAHPGEEWAHLTVGSAQMMVGKPVVSPDSPILIPPKVRHHLLALEYCEGVVLIQK